MASTYIEENEDLTTDACPSPPREDPRNCERIPDPDLKDEINVEDQQEEIRDKPPTSTHFKLPKSKPKSSKSSKVYTNVINISNANGIHIGTNVNLYMNKNDPDPFKNKKKNISLTEQIRRLFVHKEVVSKKDILDLSSYMDDGWRDTARLLNYTDAEIYQINEDFKDKGSKEVIYQFLLDWIQNNADDATSDKLATALWESNQKEAVSIWSQKLFSS